MTTINDGSQGTWGKLRNLTLPQDHKMIGGVCAALGAATPIPTWMWRVGFLGAVVFWGTGLIAYIILVICIPNAPKTES